MIVDVQAMKRNYSKEDFVWILGNLFFSNKVVYNWHSLSALCVNSCIVNTFKKHFSVQLEPSQNPVIIVNKCDIVESRRYRH